MYKNNKGQMPDQRLVHVNKVRQTEKEVNF